jgi:hypothetical protein
MTTVQSLFLLLLLLHCTPSAIIAVRAWREHHAAKPVIVSALLLAAISALSISLTAGALALFGSPAAPWVVAAGVNLVACVLPVWSRSPAAKGGDHAV